MTCTPILAEVACEFFWLLERSLKASFLQTFRQLSDGPMTMGRANASFHGLLQAMAGEHYRIEHADMVAMIERVAAPPSVRIHVNRYIAHLDLDLLTERVQAPEPLAIEEVESALAAAREFMDTFMQRFFNEPPVDYSGEAELIPGQVQDLASAGTTVSASPHPSLTTHNQRFSRKENHPMKLMNLNNRNRKGSAGPITNQAAVDRSIRALRQEMEHEEVVFPETPLGRLQRVLKIYGGIKPLLVIHTATPLIPSPWRTALKTFAQSLEALAAPEVTAAFKAGKDL